MDDRIRVTLQQGVADVRLVRADKMNALDDAMFSALIETGERLKSEAGVRAVVLSGEGRGFCAGFHGRDGVTRFLLGFLASFVLRTWGIFLISQNFPAL